MRIVFVGASRLTCTCAETMMDNGHDVVVVEKDRERIDLWSEGLDCGFVHGDGSRPSVLEEVDAGNTDCLIYLSNSDTDNILGALVAKSLDFPKVIVRIEDPDLEPVCERLGIEHVIFPDRQVAKELLSEVEDEG